MRLLPLLLGCSTPPARVEDGTAILEKGRCRVAFSGSAARVTFDGREVAVLRGPWFENPEVIDAPRPAIRFGDSYFTLKGHPLWFQTPSEVLVEVRGTRTMALFPGLELLEGDEPSSSDREGRAPDRR